MGQFWYLILNRNDDKRNVNVNQNDPQDKWNDNYRVLLCEKLYSPLRLVRGVSFVSCRCQPPSILPISNKGFEIAASFLSSMAFKDHASCRKNFKVSSLTLAFCTNADLFTLVVNPAIKIYSMTSVNRPSIFCPSVKRSSLGISGRALCHNS